jgi:hypothetical protein
MFIIHTFNKPDNKYTTCYKLLEIFPRYDMPYFLFNKFIKNYLFMKILYLIKTEGRLSFVGIQILLVTMYEMFALNRAYKLHRSPPVCVSNMLHHQLIATA